jgi:hypothetical protein
MKTLILGKAIAASITVSLIVGCANSPTDSSLFTVEVIDGLRHVHNHRPQSGNLPGVKLELVGKIGELETEDEKKILYDPVDAARLPNGDILILEGKGCRVKRFNKSYQRLSSFGRRGQGPGDFNSPYLLRLNKNRDRFYIADDKILRYSIDGRYEEGFKPERMSITKGSIDVLYQTSGLAVFSGNRVILPNGSWTGEDPGGQALLSVYDQKGTIISSFGVLRRYEDPKLTLQANVVYFTVDPADHLYIAFASQNRIDEYSADGRMIFSSDWTLPYELKNGMKAVLFKSGDVEREFLFPSVTSVTKGIYADQKNRIWVLTYLKQPDKFGEFDKKEKLADCYEFNVFDSAGTQLFKIQFPNVRFNAFSIYDDRLYLIDARNESCVYEYRIVDTR